jgi:adenosylcobinamide-GDP ribazoletransferase
MRPILSALRLAVEFLTIVPVPPLEEAPSAAELEKSRFAYPFVGLLIGLLLAGLSEGLAAIAAPAGVSAFVLLAVSVIITGGLHLDGLADTSDGLFLAASPERRLEVMRDPRVGSFGVVGLVLALVGQYAGIASLVGHGRSLGLLAAATISRTLVLAAAGVTNYARPTGTAQWLISPTRPAEAALATGFVLMIGTTLGRGAGLVAAIAAICMSAALVYLAKRRLGGSTGDILGAVVELAELAFLVTLGVVQPILAR